MKISTVEYLLSARSRADFPRRRLPEIAFAGRSNVGKSSLINALLKRRHVAKVSSTPGKTRCVNYFLINDSFYLVDLPGYGYAKVSRSEQQVWEGMVRGYLEDRDRSKFVVMLVDLRHDPGNLDRLMKSWLDSNRNPHVIAATKADKLSGNQRAVRSRQLKTFYTGTEVIPVSSVTELGRRELWNRLWQFLYPVEELI